MGIQNLHVCSECGKEFATRADLSQHEIRERRDERQFSCDICGAHFVRMAEFRLHMARHTAGSIWRVIPMTRSIHIQSVVQDTSTPVQCKLGL